jgi:hypothetical protein
MLVRAWSQLSHSSRLILWQQCNTIPNSRWHMAYFLEKRVLLLLIMLSRKIFDFDMIAASLSA